MTLSERFYHVGRCRLNIIVACLVSLIRLYIKYLHIFLCSLIELSFAVVHASFIHCSFPPFLLGQCPFLFFPLLDIDLMSGFCVLSSPSWFHIFIILSLIDLQLITLYKTLTNILQFCELFSPSRPTTYSSHFTLFRA